MMFLAPLAFVGHLSSALPQQIATDARQACRTDYQAFCSEEQPGGGRIKACLQRNADKLSQSCRVAMGMSS